MKRNRLNLIMTAVAFGIMATSGAQTVWANGACWYQDGTQCQDVANEAACETLGAGWYYQGDGTDCAANPPIVGACGHTGLLSGAPMCSNVIEDRCADLLGRWLGAGTDCAANVWANHPYTYDLPPLNLPNAGQVNMSGATLFQNFFGLPAAYHDTRTKNLDGDAVHCDGDPFAGRQDTDCNGSLDANDQIAPNWQSANWNGHWLVQYRSVGSGNGLAEFVNYQCSGTIPYSVPEEVGYINRTKWAELGFKLSPGQEANCNPGDDVPMAGNMNMYLEGVGPYSVDGKDIGAFVDAVLLGKPAWDAIYDPPNGPNGFYYNGNFRDNNSDGDFLNDAVDVEDVLGLVNCVLAGGCSFAESGAPVCPQSIDLAVMDVPTKWFVKVIGGTPSWNGTPTDLGYGNNPRSSTTGQSNKLKDLLCLNTNTGSPDASTVFDTTIAWSPVAIIANTGTGLQTATYSDLDWLLVTGRTPNGENLAAATRDSGSGTRNACMNSLGIDPSFGIGDNRGPKALDNTYTNLGTTHQVVNCGGSGIIENAVQNRRLAVGYTGVFGSSRAARDAASRRYELIGVAKDYGSPTFAEFVRPYLDRILWNDGSDPKSTGRTGGYQIGGSQTLASRGDPQEGPGNPVVDNLAARDFVMNIYESLVNFANLPEDAGTPASQLTGEFAVEVGVEMLPALTDPKAFIDNTVPNGYPGVNTVLQDIIWNTNDLNTYVKEYGYYTIYSGLVNAGLVPIRNIKSVGTYSDGSTGLTYRDGSPGGALLDASMRIQGDFDDGSDSGTADEQRDWDDIAQLVEAVDDPAAWYTAHAPRVPEIIGDMNGDGDLDADDVRYFADGLAINPATGDLDRKTGFIKVDQKWSALTGGADNNYFNTSLATPKPYAAGDARGDVAGASPWAGAEPNGHNGVVGCEDLAYVKDNFFSGTWGDGALAAKQNKDLSCDMNGDLKVDYQDIKEIVQVILGTCIGDVDLDGDVDAADVAAITSHIGMLNPHYCDGDVNADGVINATDVNIANGNIGGPPCPATP